MRVSKKGRPRSKTRRNTVLPDITLPDLPLLSAEEEFRLGTRIRIGLKRLDQLVRSHPVGYRLILSRLRAVCEKRIQVYSWFRLKERFQKDLKRATSLLERSRQSAERSPKTARRYLNQGREVLAMYPLEPESLISIAGKILRSTDPCCLNSSGSPGKPTRLVGRVLHRLTTDRDHLVLSNQRLLAKEVLRYRPLGMESSDLYQEGMFGLGKAAFRFDVDRKIRFSTYATYWIRQTIRKSLADSSRLIRIPQPIQNQLRKGSEEGGLPPRELERVRQIMNQPVLFSSGPNNGSGEDSAPDFNLASKAAYKPGLRTDTIPDAVRSVVESLGERERFVVESRFGLGNSRRLTLEEVGAALDLSRERVRQIELETLDNMKRVGGLQEVYEDLVEVDSGELVSAG